VKTNATKSKSGAKSGSASAAAVAKPNKRVEPIPAGRQLLIPSINVRDGAKAIEFYKKVFGARELGCNLRMPDGKVAHAELHFGGDAQGHGSSVLMVADENPEWGNRSPQSVGGTPATLHLYVEDVDAVCALAVKHGAKLLAPPANQFYGDRAGRIQDPFGHVWGLASHVEDVSIPEMERRFGEWTKGPPKK
jgi:PhnB protein